MPSGNPNMRAIQSSDSPSRKLNAIRKNQTEPGQSVRSIIVARHISEDLLLACSGVQGVQLFQYELSVSLRQAGLE